MGRGVEPTHAAACGAAGTHPAGPHPAAAPRGAVLGCRGVRGVGVPLALAAHAKGASGVRCWQGLSNGQDVPVPSLPRRLPRARPAAGQAEGPREIFLTPVLVSVCPSCEPLQPHSRAAALSLLLLGSAGCAGRTRPSLQQRYWGSTSGSHHGLEGEGSEGTAPGPRGPGTEGQVGGAGLGARPRGGCSLRAAPAPTLPAGTPTSAGG